MKINTIGFALNVTDTKADTHISPALFFNDPDLQHLSWVNTIYPKDVDLKENMQNCCEQLANYTEYYKKNPLLIIGGDQTAILGASLSQPSSNLIILSANNPTTPPDQKTIIDTLLQKTTHELYLSHPTQTSSRIHPMPHDNIDGQKMTILCIDVSFLHSNTQSSQIIDTYITKKPQITVICGYSLKIDPQQHTMQALKRIILALTAN